MGESDQNTEARVAALHRALLETQDDAQRAEAHLSLGRIALSQRRVDLAIRHFREALLLRPDMDRARQALAALGEFSRVQSRQSPIGQGRSRIRQILARFKRKSPVEKPPEASS